MKNKYLILLMLLIAGSAFAQEAAFKDGEWFRFRISYSGWWKAGEATLSVNNETLKGKPVYHVKGKGVTTGMTKLFFGPLFSAISNRIL